MRRHLTRARRSSRRVPRSHPACSKALGKASAPVPTTRLKMKIADVLAEKPGDVIFSFTSFTVFFNYHIP